MLSKIVGIFSFAVTLMLSIAFLMAGGTKLIGMEMHVQNFATWGYEPWFMYAVGLTEILGGAALWAKSKYAALTLSVVMMGATVTLIINSEPFVVPAILGIFAIALAYRWSNNNAQRF